MKTLSLNSAIRRYNNIMFSIGCEHMTVGTEFSEDTDHFGIREMVNECKYWLGTFREGSHANSDMRYSDNEEERKIWRSSTGKLERFINTYSPFV